MVGFPLIAYDVSIAVTAEKADLDIRKILCMSAKNWLCSSMLYLFSTQFSIPMIKLAKTLVGNNEVTIVEKNGVIIVNIMDTQTNEDIKLGVGLPQSIDKKGSFS